MKLYQREPADDELGHVDVKVADVDELRRSRERRDVDARQVRPRRRAVARRYCARTIIIDSWRTRDGAGDFANPSLNAAIRGGRWICTKTENDALTIDRISERSASDSAAARELLRDRHVTRTSDRVQPLVDVLRPEIEHSERK
jgi:hypothetical protein